MAGMFCSLREAAERLNKTEYEIKELVEQGRLREFRDGASLLLKVDEIEALAAEEGIELASEAPPQKAPAPAHLPGPSPESEMIDLGLKPPGEDELEALEPAEAELGLSALDDADVEIREAESADLDIPELGALEPEDIPAAQLDEREVPAEMPADEELPAKEPGAKPKGKKKKKERKAKAKKEKPKKVKPPKVRMVKIADTQPSASFGEWLVDGLREDSIVAIVVLVLLMGIVLAAIVALVYVLATYL